MTRVTKLLQAIGNENDVAAEELLPLIYDELRSLAAARMKRESADQVLQATALVHEAYLRLVGEDQADSIWHGRAHFFAAAAEAMRRILVESHRRKQTVKHGGQANRVELHSGVASSKSRSDRIIELNDAIRKLTAIDPTKAKLVELRLFAGCSTSEAAEVLGLSVASAHRYWTYCRAWLKVELC